MGVSLAEGGRLVEPEVREFTAGLGRTSTNCTLVRESSPLRAEKSVGRVPNSSRTCPTSSGTFKL